MIREKKIYDSFNVQIWCGLKEGYDGKIHTLDDVRIICQEFVNFEKDCVTMTPTEFIYVNGNEPGVIIGFILYPRFERETKEILLRAKLLGEQLLIGLKQQRLTITTPDNSIMLENIEL